MFSDNVSGAVLAEVSFVAAITAASHDAVLSGGRDSGLGVNHRAESGIALVAMVAIVAPDNPTPYIATTDQAHVLSDDIQTCNQLVGPEMPLILHGLTADSDVARALRAHLGKDHVVSGAHGGPDLQGLVLGFRWFF